SGGRLEACRLSLKIGIEPRCIPDIPAAMNSLLKNQLRDVAADSHEPRKHDRPDEFAAVFDPKERRQPLFVGNDMVEQKRVGFGQRVIAGVFEFGGKMWRCPSVMLSVTRLMKK